MRKMIISMCMVLTVALVNAQTPAVLPRDVYADRRADKYLTRLPNNNIRI